MSDQHPTHSPADTERLRIVRLGLPSATTLTIVRACLTIHQLRTMSDQELLDVHGIGRTTVAQIRTALNAP